MRLTRSYGNASERSGRDGALVLRGSHGDRAGDLLSTGFVSSYRPEVTLNHAYTGSTFDGAGLAA